MEASFQQNQPFQLVSVVEGEATLRTVSEEFIIKKEIILFFLLESKVLL